MKKQIYLAATLLALIMSATSLTNAQNWLLTGNGTLKATDFLGTTKNNPLVIKTSNTERMRILPANGFIGIGTAAPLFPVDLLNTNNYARSLNIDHTVSNTGLNVAINSKASNTGVGATYGFYSDIPATSTGNGFQGAYYGSVSGTGNNNHYGLFTQLSGTGTGSQYGTSISISNTGTGTHYGIHSVLSGSNAVTKYGVYSSTTGGSNNYAFYGIGRSYFSDNVGIGVTLPSAKLEISSSESTAVSIKNEYSGSGVKTGIRNELTDGGIGPKFGMYNLISSASNSFGSGYGIYNSLNNPGSGTSYGISSTVTSGKASSAYGIYNKLNSGSGIAWGIFSESSNTSNADAYGIYATASSTGSNNSRYGVRGYASSNNSINVESYGVYGVANGGGPLSRNYGVYGSASGGSSSYAGYFDGLTYTDELRVGSTLKVAGYIVSIDGKIICEELKVQNSDNWPDYVFDANYKLPSLEEVEQHIIDKKHLPGIPSASEVEEDGLFIGEMQKKMMEKIEELTLYVIELKKENNVLSQRLLKVEIKN